MPTIYVRLLDEGTEVWRPVESELVAPGLYRLDTVAPAEERWEFAPGSLVECEPRSFAPGESELAVVRVHVA